MTKPDVELAVDCQHVIHSLYGQRKLTPIEYAESNCNDVDFWNRQLCKAMGWSYED